MDNKKSFKDLLIYLKMHKFGHMWISSLLRFNGLFSITDVVLLLLLNNIIPRVMEIKLTQMMTSEF